MTIFHYTGDELIPIGETTFGAEGIMERKDLQRLLRGSQTPVDILVRTAVQRAQPVRVQRVHRGARLHEPPHQARVAVDARKAEGA